MATSMAALRVLLSDQDKINATEDQELIDAWIQVEEEHAKDSEMLNRMAFSLQKRMEERGATAIAHPTHDCTFVSRANTYDQASMTPILELVPEATAVADGAYVAPWEEKATIQHEGQWDVKKARALKKYNPEVNNVVERAKTPSRPSLKITPKAPAK